MKKVALSVIFNIEYGNQLDLNKLDIDLNDGVNFISRSRENLGVYTKVKKINNEKIFKKGSITTSLGGSYLLSSFVQKEDFYTAQNIKVLTPKQPLSDVEKKFYCYAIENNRFRFTSHGRESNKTLDDLLVPQLEDFPKWMENIEIPKKPSKDSFHNNQKNLNSDRWNFFELGRLFTIERGDVVAREMHSNRKGIPLISSTAKNNGVHSLIVKNHEKHLFDKNKLTVASNGAVGETFYQKRNFYCTHDINVLTPLFPMNKYNGIFLATVIGNEKYRFNYGRKWGTRKMEKSKIKLPSKIIKNDEHAPDWQFMEDYVKSLPYSSNL